MPLWKTATLEFLLWSWNCWVWGRFFQVNLINSMTKVAARQRVIAAPAGSPEVALGSLCSTEERLRVNATLLSCGSCSSNCCRVVGPAGYFAKCHEWDLREWGTISVSLSSLWYSDSWGYWEEFYSEIQVLPNIWQSRRQIKRTLASNLRNFFFSLKKPQYFLRAWHMFLGLFPVFEHGANMTISQPSAATTLFAYSPVH